MTGRSRCPDLGDDRENDVLRRNTGLQRSAQRDPQRLRLALPECLGGEDMGDLGRSDAEGQRAERPMRRGVAVPTNDQHSRLTQALLGSDHMHDSLPGIVKTEVLDARGGAVLPEGLSHRSLLGVRDARQITAVGRNVVIRRRKGPLRNPRLQSTLPEHLERRGRAVLQEVSVDIQQRLAVLPHQDRVFPPDLFEERQGDRVHRLQCTGSPGVAPWARPKLG